ncbi:hypothetical protein [Dolichospermum sp. UHCC 0259]|uniref:hypothetical protein n=1 Tax=Dolichospermum sp. UHCC 0259 TaxID=2590010 RepID=UPI001580F8D1|nr:hypothetical protein [Dolichospermum sp. UHCC 0259]
MNLYQQNLPNHHLTTQTALISLPTYQPTLANIDFSKFLQQYNNPQGWTMMAGLLVVLILLQISGTGKGKITTGKVCGVSEKLAATNLAFKQIKEHKHNKVTLWSGTSVLILTGKPGISFMQKV